MATIFVGVQLAWLTTGGVIPTAAADEPVSLIDFLAEPSWSTPTVEDVSVELETWLAAQPIDPAIRQQALNHWEDALAEFDDETTRLDALAAALSAGDPQVADLARKCHAPACGRLPCGYACLESSSFPPLVRQNMRLFYARWLVQAGLYDEALAALDGVEVDQVVAPATLLFYQAVAHHQLVHPDEADSLALRLLERPDELPRRYRQLADLMRKDVEGLEDDSLDHIARRMADIERRLSHGQSGATVQQVEEGVLASLDKLIDELEKAQQQMQQQSQSMGPPSGQPMEDSMPAEMKGPGKVDQRNLDDTAEWGDVPPKDREQALQQIGREFPSHYRELIEQYFRELANESSGESP